APGDAGERVSRAAVPSGGGGGAAVAVWGAGAGRDEPGGAAPDLRRRRGDVGAADAEAAAAAAGDPVLQGRVAQGLAAAARAGDSVCAAAGGRDLREDAGGAAGVVPGVSEGVDRAGRGGSRRRRGGCARG